MSKHTPGPWKARYVGGDAMRNIYIEGEHDHAVASLWIKPKGEAEANARLITAAPALLEAMERAEHHLRNPSRGVPPVQVANNLRKAIAAAKGE